MPHKNPPIKKRGLRGPQETAKTWGFTLVEMLIVIVIVSVITSIAVPALNRSKADTQEVKRKTIQTAVETAKNRYALSQEDSSYEGQNAAFAHIQPYLLINGRSPVSFEEIASKNQNKAGANIVSLGTYWSSSAPAQPMSWGDDPPSE
jgi:prepilin-type N-terminal cleavage/methylation domain-containing protein